MTDELCNIPIRARFESVNGGRPVMVSAEYALIPANAIAEYLLRNFDALGVER